MMCVVQQYSIKGRRSEGEKKGVMLLSCLKEETCFVG